MKQFEIPVVIFFMHRQDLVLQVLDQIAKVKPKKLYLLGDGGRSKDEWKLVYACRSAVETRIDWDCEVIKDYAEVNRGVYGNIGQGALRVFQKEERAIFLEDDNRPEETFFYFCEEMLERYKDDTRVLWVCGTNYLEKYEPQDGSSYVFTQHLLPCGWASWSHKFTNMYDGDMVHFNEPGIKEKLKYSYEDKDLYWQQEYAISGTLDKLKNNKRVSWDHQMCYSLRINSAYGISPKYNQIQNIGADERSTHGGTSMNKVMTKRFCGIRSFPLKFPLVHPNVVMKDSVFETKTKDIILMPLSRRILVSIVRLVKPLFGYGKYDSVTFSNLKEKIFRKK